MELEASVRAMWPAYHWLSFRECIGSDPDAPGWKLLIECLLEDIDNVLTDTEAVLFAVQIKEKLGTLRFYRRLEHASDDQKAKIDLLVKSAMTESSATCIVCGAEGSLRQFRCIEPLCEQHACERESQHIR